MPENTPTQDQEAMEERQALAQHIINCLSPHGMKGLKLMTGAGPFALEKNGLSFRFKESPEGQPCQDNPEREGPLRRGPDENQGNRLHHRL